MKILFANDSLRMECNNQELLVKRYGSPLARILRQRLDELFNAQSLQEMRSMPHVSITSDPSGNTDLHLELEAGNRLDFRPHPPAEPGHAGLDWGKIDSILILGLSK